MWPFSGRQDDIVQAMPPSSKGIDIENVPETRPIFKRSYTSQVTPEYTATIVARTFFREDRAYDGEIRQKDGRWVLFDPLRCAEKILDADLLPRVQEFCDRVLKLDAAFIATSPDTFTDEDGTIWVRSGKPNDIKR